MIAERLIEQGVAPDRARARAREEFGDFERARVLCEGIGAEQARRHEWGEMFDSLAKDVRFFPPVEHFSSGNPGNLSTKTSALRP